MDQTTTFQVMLLHQMADLADCVTSHGLKADPLTHETARAHEREAQELGEKMRVRAAAFEVAFGDNGGNQQ